MSVPHSLPCTISCPGSVLALALPIPAWRTTMVLSSAYSIGGTSEKWSQELLPVSAFGLCHSHVWGTFLLQAVRT